MPQQLSAADIAAITFEPTRFRIGYEPDEVDAFLDAVEVALRSGQDLGPIVAKAQFTLTRFRDGYDQAEVDELVELLRQPDGPPGGRRSQHRAADPALRPRRGVNGMLNGSAVNGSATAPAPLVVGRDTSPPDPSAPLSESPDPSDLDPWEPLPASVQVSQPEAAPQPGLRPGGEPPATEPAPRPSAEPAPEPTPGDVTPEPGAPVDTQNWEGPALGVRRQGAHEMATLGGLTADEVDAVRFATTRRARPYDTGSVDTFLDEVAAALREGRPPRRNRPDFPAAEKSGYRRKEVDQFVSRLTSTG